MGVGNDPRVTPRERVLGGCVERLVFGNHPTPPPRSLSSLHSSILYAPLLVETVYHNKDTSIMPWFWGGKNDDDDDDEEYSDDEYTDDDYESEESYTDEDEEEKADEPVLVEQVHENGNDETPPPSPPPDEARAH